MTCDSLVYVNEYFECNFALYNLKHLQLIVNYESLPAMNVITSSLKREKVISLLIFNIEAFKRSNCQMGRKKATRK
jgi:hypothetical protein